VQSLTKIGASMYEAAGAQPGDEEATTDSSSTADDESTVEGEFREVGSDR